MTQDQKHVSPSIHPYAYKKVPGIRSLTFNNNYFSEGGSEVILKLIFYTLKKFFIMKTYLQKQMNDFYSKKKMTGSKYAKMLIAGHSGCGIRGDISPSFISVF